MNSKNGYKSTKSKTELKKYLRKQKVQEAGITLIALVVTIIILLILSGVAISQLTSSGLISRAGSAANRTYLAAVMEEFNEYIMGLTIDGEGEADISSLMANSKTIRYKQEEIGTSIKEILTQIKDGDEKKFEILSGSLYLKSTDEDEIAVAKKCGFKINPYNVVDGVLRSSDSNLLLVDSNGTLDLTEFEDSEDQIKTIEAGAFSNTNISGNMSELKNIILPRGLTKIEANAFSYNTNLESIEIPDTVTTIGNYAFSGCTSLKTIVIPNSVTSIGTYCFNNCTKLSSIKLSENIKTISARTFNCCYSLTDLNLPDSIETIKGYCSLGFLNKLTSLRLPKNLKNLDGAALQGLANLKEIIVPDGNNNFKFENGLLLSKNGKEMYMALLSLTEITIPEGVEVMNATDVLSGSKATTINLPASLKSNIEGTMFNRMSRLTKINVSSESKNLKIVDENLYSYDMKRLIKYMNSSTDYKIPEGVEVLTMRCITKKMTSLELPSTLKTIPEWSLGSVSGIEVLNIPENVTYLSNSSFRSGQKLRVAEGNSKYKSIDDIYILSKDGTKLMAVSTAETSYNIPNTVKEISNGAFYECNNVQSINIPEGVTTIGSGAFFGCDVLKSVTIPNSMTTISENAFEACKNLTEIKINKSSGNISGSPWGATIGNRAVIWNS